MSKKAFVTAFNENFIKLTKTIHQLVPDNKQLETIKNAVHIGSKVKPELYINNFYEHVVIPYETHILDKNQEFFLNLDFSMLSDFISSEQAEEANILKHKWNSFTNEQQDILWKYMVVLTKLSQRWKNCV